ncbi:antibiotic biosynthesis monooxygenase [Novosphingobium sp. KCTC 2891]|uniref:putative quinol monooxygenase n=1 Tax=Novosphingobium sp. KCTC 2891 TaxID=2989730 RepID=UPI00222195C6|nr:putative quinol monooxygenase [Novosphingobium sp. KCTC 2891]MCW1382600.1 antibiotic biosynthesis monooxygenase [Novosphingobium sp. KCTC 2891]
MMIVMGTFRVPAANIPAILPAMERVVSATRAEDGCLLYAYSQDVFDPELIHVSEKWRDRAALAAHFKAPHMTAWVKERAAFGLFDRQIRLFETDDGEAV